MINNAPALVPVVSKTIGDMIHFALLGHKSAKCSNAQCPPRVKAQEGKGTCFRRSRILNAMMPLKIQKSLLWHRFAVFFSISIKDPCVILFWIDLQKTNTDQRTCHWKRSIDINTARKRTIRVDGGFPRASHPTRSVELG